MLTTWTAATCQGVLMPMYVRSLTYPYTPIQQSFPAAGLPFLSISALTLSWAVSSWSFFYIVKTDSTSNFLRIFPIMPQVFHRNQESTKHYPCFASPPFGTPFPSTLLMKVNKAKQSASECVWRKMCCLWVFPCQRLLAPSFSRLQISLSIPSLPFFVINFFKGEWVQAGCYCENLHLCTTDMFFLKKKNTKILELTQRKAPVCHYSCPKN